MATKIEWCINPDGTQGETLNIWTGCKKISPGCKNCYAEKVARKFAGKYGYPEINPFSIQLHADRLLTPTKMRKSRMIFLISMGDFFHEGIQDEVRDQVVDMMRGCPHHIFVILTKRNCKMVEYSEKIVEWPDNCIIGVSVENNDYTFRIDDLREINAKTKMVSFEPLIGAIQIRENLLDGISWVICGGETGLLNRRVMTYEMVNPIKNLCLEKDIPFFFKNWGNGQREIDHQLYFHMPAIWHEYRRKYAS